MSSRPRAPATSIPVFPGHANRKSCASGLSQSIGVPAGGWVVQTRRATAYPFRFMASVAIEIVLPLAFSALPMLFTTASLNLFGGMSGET